MPKTNGGTLGVGVRSQEDPELLHWSAGDGGVLCGSEDFVWVTLDRGVFDAHARACLACDRCADSRGS
jgi:hypothetical protein